jgi:rRNA processing protein Gar1
MHTENEQPRFLLSTGHEHPDRDSNDQITHQTDIVEYKILPVAGGEDQGEQIICDRYPVDYISSHQGDKDANGEGVNNVMWTMCVDMKHTKLTTDEMLDDVNFSDEEVVVLHTKKENITHEGYQNEIKKISELYEDTDDTTLNKYTGTRHEVDERKEIPEPFNIEPGQTMIEAGNVDDIVEHDKVIIKVNLYNGILDLDNVIFTANKIAFGYIDDVIGKVDDPYYVVRFFPNITDRSIIQRGHTAYFVNQKAKSLQTNKMLRKGCDASNAFDEEVSEDEMEFSDDEEEISRKKSKVLLY